MYSLVAGPLLSEVLQYEIRIDQLVQPGAQGPHENGNAESCDQVEITDASRYGVWVSPEGERMEYELGAPAEFADWSAAAKNLADQLTKFGIKTTVRTVTFTQWDPRVLDGQFEMGIQAWGEGQPHPIYSFETPLLTYNVDASGGGISYDMNVETQSFGNVDLEKLIIQSASGLDEEDQKATVTKLCKIFNELLPVIPLWERYGNNPALEGVRVTGWLPDSDPIYQNSPYEDSFTVIMIMDGTLKPAGQ